MESAVAAVGGAGLDPRERVEFLVSQGRIAREEVERAEQFWRDHLVNPVSIPSGELVQVRLSDLYHAIVDDRVLRRPERIEYALRSVYEMRRAEEGRRLALSQWDEAGFDRFASIVIETDNTLKMIHLIDQRRIRKYQRAYQEVLWTR